MPKSRKNRAKGSQSRFNAVIRTKFKVGARKSSVGAQSLNNTKLLEMLSPESNTRPRDQHKLRQIAVRRGL